jgi:hypothetical protein
MIEKRAEKFGREAAAASVSDNDYILYFPFSGSRPRHEKTLNGGTVFDCEDASAW